MSALNIDMDGRFAGYASLFGQVDQGGDIVMPGAFKRSLLQKGQAGIRMLFQHDPKEPVGTWERIAEDDKVLWVEGRLIEDAPRGAALKNLIDGGALDGLSIGFRARRAQKDRAAGHRRLFEIDLWEISIVTFPMMEGARILPRAQRPDAVRQVRPLQESLLAAISLFQN